MRFNLRIKNKSTARYPTGQVGYGSLTRATTALLSPAVSAVPDGG